MKWIIPVFLVKYLFFLIQCGEVDIKTLNFEKIECSQITQTNIKPLSIYTLKQQQKSAMLVLQYILVMFHYK